MQHDIEYWTAEQLNIPNGVRDANIHVAIGVLSELIIRSSPIGGLILDWFDPREYGPHIELQSP